MPETRLSIELVDEPAPVVHEGPHRAAREDVAVSVDGAGRVPRGGLQTPPPLRRVTYVAEPRVTDNPMRLPSFNATCPHVRDQIIPMNGGRFNVDQYLRVLRAKAELDVSVAMALTVRAD